MTQWDRKALLRLLEDAGHALRDPDISVTQRHSLQALMAHYSPKAKSIHATYIDVRSMTEQLTEILVPNESED